MNVVSVVLWTESDVTVMCAFRAASTSATVVCGPLSEAMRNAVVGGDALHVGKALELLEPSAGVLEKLTSRILVPGIDAFNFRGESSATSFP